MTVTREIVPATTTLASLLRKVKFAKPRCEHRELTMPDGDTIYVICIKDKETGKGFGMSKLPDGRFEVEHWG